MPPESNRIEVDLQVLRDQNFEALERFGNQFTESVTALQSALATYAGQIQLAAQQVSGNAGAHASVAKPEDPATQAERITQRRKDLGLTDTPRWGDNIRNRVEPVDLTPTSPPAKDNASKARMTEYPYALAGTNINDYERGALRLQNLAGMDAPQFLRYLSYEVGRRGWDEEGNPTGRQWYRDWSNRLGRSAEGLTSFQSSLAAARRTGDLITRIVHAGSSSADFYAQLGYQRDSGFLGVPTPFGSSAWWQNVKGTAGDFWHSWFGLNPNLTTKEAREIRMAVASSGWTGDQAGQYQKALQNIRSTYGITDFPTMMGMLDKATRFGTESVNEFTDSMRGVREAAMAAHMPINQLLTSLDSAAQSLAGQIGTPYSYAVNQLAGFTAGTGLDPSRATGILGSQMLQYMTLARHPGMGLYDLVNGRNYSGMMLQTQMDFASQVASPGHPWQSWEEWSQKDPAGWAHFRNNLQRIYQQDPSILGGLTPQELITQAFRNGPGVTTLHNLATTLGSRMQRFLHNGQWIDQTFTTRPIALGRGVERMQQIQTGGRFMAASPLDFEVNLRDMISRANLTTAQKRQLYSSIRDQFSGAGYDPLSKAQRQADFERRFHETLAQAVRTGFTDDERKYLSSRNQKIEKGIQNFVAKQNLPSSQKNRLEIALSPDARQLLTIVQPPKANSNTRAGFSSPAITTGSGSSASLALDVQLDPSQLQQLYNVEGGKPSSFSGYNTNGY